jgi:hypothetical protein
MHPYRLEDVEKTAEFVFRRWIESPLVQRWLGLQAASAEARLAAGIAELRTASLIAGAPSLALTLGVPLAVWVGVFAAMGAPYAEARALVRNENFQSGFSQGFVAGLLKWDWRQTTSRLFQFAPSQNPTDESLGYIAANARNEGLRAGFIQAVGLNVAATTVLLHRLRSLSPSTRAGAWDLLHQKSYVIDLASAGRRHGVFKVSDE